MRDDPKVVLEAAPASLERSKAHVSIFIGSVWAPFEFDAGDAGTPRARLAAEIRMYHRYRSELEPGEARHLHPLWLAELELLTLTPPSSLAEPF